MIYAHGDQCVTSLFVTSELSAHRRPPRQQSPSYSLSLFCGINSEYGFFRVTTADLYLIILAEIICLLDIFIVSMVFFSTAFPPQQFVRTQFLPAAMSHSSPASYLVWSLLTAILGAFLVFHLWSFDRFKCLKWDTGAYSGAFKRVMTYSYLITVPMIFTYACGNAIIKYHEGWVDLPTYGIMPKPYALWEQSAKNTVLPLMLLFSVGWSLEMVTHLEELCFWLFLVNSGSSQQNWFQSLYFKTWVIGSACAVTYMPLVTILTRSDPLKSEAYTFLAGSLGSLTLTLWFTPILWTFPGFLKNLKMEGVDIGTIVRLTKFSELNLIRVVFRFLFVVPLLILGVDGVRPHKHINENMLWVDFLTFIAGLGCVISSAITLVIFFPRSIEGEIAARDAEKERKLTRSLARSGSALDSASVGTSIHGSSYHQPSLSGQTYLLSSPIKKSGNIAVLDQQIDYPPPGYADNGSTRKGAWDDEERDIATNLPPLKPQRKKVKTSDSEGLTETNLSAHTLRVGNVNPMVSNFTSPIDFQYGEVTGKELRPNRRK